MSAFHPSSCQVRRGLSLLEVMLAIAILGGSIAVIGELIRVGTISAAKTRDLTTAQILCESTLAEGSTAHGSIARKGSARSSFTFAAPAVAANSREVWRSTDQGSSA